MKNTIQRILILFCLFPCTAWAQQDQIRWMDFSALDDSLKVQPKKVLISFYTDWCTYCRKMDKEVYTDPAIIAHINQHYYAVRMDAESPDSIWFDGQLFTNKRTTKRRKGYHELALLLGGRQGRMSVPVTLFLQPDFNIIHARYEYLDRKKLKTLL
jgi:thioredoxin-related protein